MTRKDTCTPDVGLHNDHVRATQEQARSSSALADPTQSNVVTSITAVHTVLDTSAGLIRSTLRTKNDRVLIPQQLRASNLA